MGFYDDKFSELERKYPDYDDSDFLAKTVRNHPSYVDTVEKAETRFDTSLNVSDDSEQAGKAAFSLAEARANAVTSRIVRDNPGLTREEVRPVVLMSALKDIDDHSFMVEDDRHGPRFVRRRRESADEEDDFFGDDDGGDFDQESSASSGPEDGVGRCARCGRELSQGESIERGLGPICAQKEGVGEAEEIEEREEEQAPEPEEPDEAEEEEPEEEPEDEEEEESEEEDEEPTQEFFIPEEDQEPEPSGESTSFDVEEVETVREEEEEDLNMEDGEEEEER